MTVLVETLCAETFFVRGQSQMLFLRRPRLKPILKNVNADTILFAGVDAPCSRAFL